MVKRKELSSKQARKGPRRKHMKGAKAPVLFHTCTPLIPYECMAAAMAFPKFVRSHERFTWKGVLYSDGERVFKILPPPRHREGIDVDGSCTWFSMASALEAANRACGIEVGQLSWEDLLELVGTQAQFRINSCLRALKYKGIRTRADFLEGNMEAKRYRIAQYTEFCHWQLINEHVISGLDKDNIKAAIDSALSKSPVICYFPISDNYFQDFQEEMGHIYRYDETQRQRMPNGTTATHTAVVTGFGFEEDIPYFQILDCNGKEFGKKGFCRILPSSIISMFAFDILQD